MPISSRTLFKKSGSPIDLLESALVEEGWLFPGEVLLEVLKTESNLHRVQFGREEYTAQDLGDFPDDWEEEDYISFYKGESVSHGMISAVGDPVSDGLRSCWPCLAEGRSRAGVTDS